MKSVGILIIAWTMRTSFPIFECICAHCTVVHTYTPAASRYRVWRGAVGIRSIFHFPPKSQHTIVNRLLWIFVVVNVTFYSVQPHRTQMLQHVYGYAYSSTSNLYMANICRGFTWKIASRITYTSEMGSHAHTHNHRRNTW